MYIQASGKCEWCGLKNPCMLSVWYDRNSTHSPSLWCIIGFCIFVQFLNHLCKKLEFLPHVIHYSHLKPTAFRHEFKVQLKENQFRSSEQFFVLIANGVCHLYTIQLTREFMLCATTLGNSFSACIILIVWCHFILLTTFHSKWKKWHTVLCEVERHELSATSVLQYNVVCTWLRKYFSSFFMRYFAFVIPI